ncbi:MAG: hypothetical protein CSB23_05410 [Deltaproteobacteria bacterium]|nr:MAG: hypothetical protein CSB23_05410 [Deltaproteobacteria bacterium]
MSPMKNNRQRPRRVSPTHEKRLVKRALVFLAIVAFLWVLFAPGFGIVSYLQRYRELKKIKQQVTQLQLDNESLEEDIRKTKTDPEHLEKKARKDHNMLKPNEKVYSFSKEQKTQKK